jgi:hypothetical protein
MLGRSRHRSKSTTQPQKPSLKTPLEANMNTQSLPALGFLAVEVQIHRPPGDPSNHNTWPFPLIRAVVPHSSESQIVTANAYPSDLIDHFVKAGQELVEKGCVGIITSCGFLALAQRELSSRLPIPISTSALVQIPSICALLGGDVLIGVLTYDAERLGDAHLENLHIDPKRVRVKGMPKDGHLRAVIQKGVEYDRTVMERETSDAAVELLESTDLKSERIGALVLECTQMPPYAEAIRCKVAVPVYDVYTMGMWFYSGLVRRTPVQWNA